MPRRRVCRREFPNGNAKRRIVLRITSDATGIAASSVPHSSSVEATMIQAATSQHRAIPWMAIVVGATTTVAIGLLAAGSVLSSTSDARARAYTTPTFSTFTPVDSSGPKTFDMSLPLSLTPIPSSSLALATGALDTTPNDRSTNGSKSVVHALTNLRSEQGPGVSWPGSSDNFKQGRISQ